MQLIETNEDLAVALANSYDHPVLLLKTSNVCSISLRVYNNFKDLEKNSPELSQQMYVLVVQDAREVSNAIESRFGIIHESPQAVVVHNEDPIYYESHEEISAEKVEKLLKEKRSEYGSVSSEE